MTISHNGAHIGLFGGTFNPIHGCHLQVAEACRNALNLERIRFIPAGVPPQKHHDLAPAPQRLEMVRIAIAGQPHFEVDDLELHRSGPSYTLDTVKILQAREPDTAFNLILGLDAVLGMAGWHRPHALLQALPVAVLFRSGASFDALRQMPLFQPLDFAPLADAGRQPVTLKGGGMQLTLLSISPCSHSATAIRGALAAGKQPIPGLSPALHRYIIEHQLYD